jgi:hypothetical protein
MNSTSKESLKGRYFIGKVVDNDDPEREGRCKIMIFGLFETEDPVLDGKNKPTGETKKTEISVEAIPWAHPSGRKMFAGGDGGFADISVPKIGTVVRVQFAEGELYSPEYTAIQTVNPAVSAELEASYLNSHVLAYDVDEEMKVLYTPSIGMQIFHKSSQITINPDSSITIEHAGSSSIIELVGPEINITANSTINITSSSLIKHESSEVAMNGTSVTKLGPAPTYSAVMAEPLWVFLKALAAAVDTKLPATPGVYTGQAAAAEQLSTSKNVKVSA